uniref:Xanthine dehydrogenase, molybdenum binding subunit apoprotein n=1 Tax=Solibacter usitatus (strain Ellin6076) TaxID=234267 RepID=Q020N1_SOLUE
MQNSIGQPIQRVEGRAKVTGKATYSAEHKVPNLAYAVMVTSTIAKGRVISIDTAVAQRAPGVLAILTAQNAPKYPKKQKSRPTDRDVQYLQDNQVRYANQPVAVVVAETWEGARQAAQDVVVHYAVERHSVELEPNAAAAYKPEKGGAHNEPTDESRGDIASLATAEVKVDHVYTTQFQVHNPMEPHATIAVWESPDKLTLYDATQGPFSDRERVAELLGLAPDNIRVIDPFLGGGFGSKGPTWSHVVLAAMAAQRVNRPVKLVVERPQMFGPVGFRSHTRQTVAAGANKDGTLVALRHDTVAQTSSFDEFLESAGMAARMLYTSPANASRHRLVRTDIGTPSFTRAPGWAAGTNVLEVAIDEMAYALKMDPLEFRLKNYAEQDPEMQRPWSSKSLRECYRLGAERFGWSRRQWEPRSMREGNSLVGWGMASSAYPVHRTAAAARARVHPDGSILVESGTQDLGTGTYTVMTQVAADAIGVPASQVTFRLGDTQEAEAPVAAGSQTATSVGSAVNAAGSALREKLAQLAISDSSSPLHGAALQDVVLRGGALQVRGAESRTESLATLFARHGQSSLEAEAGAKPGSEQDQYSMYTFGAQFAEVRVDAALGQMRVSRMVGVFGAGRILNPRTARSQFMGGMVWGIGFALYENAVMDPRLGRFVNNNLAEYHIPVNADVPALEALWVDEKDTHVNPLGVKGIGEIGITGAAAAINNAVFHATGKRIRDYPITLDQVL